MPAGRTRRAVLVAVALVVAGGAAPALAGTAEQGASRGTSSFCVLTDYDPATGQRHGVCVWVPVDPPLSAR